MSFTQKEQTNRDTIVENIKNIIEDHNITVKCLEMINSENEIVLLGECTHGTEEFYEIRSDISKNLIMNHGYRVLFIEAEWPDIYRVNQYVQGKKGDSNAKEALSDIISFPIWMWKNEIFLQLIEWVKEYNQSNKEEMVYILGIDCQQFLKSRKSVIDFLYSFDREFHEVIHNLTEVLGRFTSESHYAECVVKGSLRPLVDNIMARLQTALSTYQWDKADGYFKNHKELGLDPMDILSGEQSLEILVNGEEYFRKMLEEPPGSQASWNTRDQHMLMSIMRLRTRYRDISGKNECPKIIVWAHNSHIGNSNATNRGGAGFEQNNTWNVGQMVKEMFPKTIALGFYTNSGTVYAAKKYSKYGEVQELLPAKLYSYEHFFHNVSKKYEIPRFMIDLRPYQTKPNHRKDYSKVLIRRVPSNYRNIDTGEVHTAFARIPKKHSSTALLLDLGEEIMEFSKYGSICDYCYKVDTLLPEDIGDWLNSGLCQRWIGVHYIHDTELQSHYGESNLAYQYDGIVFIDETKAINIRI
jgi:erythromycin esterase-like protein